MSHGLQDFSSLTKDKPWVHSSESTESYPLDQKGIPLVIVI